MFNEFWTIGIEGKYLNSNICCDYTKNLINAIKFETLEDIQSYKDEILRKDKSFKILKVTCIIEEEV